MRKTFFLILVQVVSITGYTQEPVRLKEHPAEKKIDVIVGNKFFTSFWFPDSLEKPVLYPVHAANDTMVTRGFPFIPMAGDPTDHPHHLGIWFNFENVNGLDFWNNSYAIPASRKSHYGWIRVTGRPQTASGTKSGTISYRANWTNQQSEVLLQETTQMIFSGSDDIRIIDRITELVAQKELVFKDAKDGMLGFRMAHALQIPEKKDKSFKDEKGNITVVKAVADTIANGNYLTSEGKEGNEAWGTRASWCKLFGKIGIDSVSVIIFDHPKNINYPSWWHARGYGLFAVNPLGAQIFSNGKTATNMTLKPGEARVFRYRIVIHNGRQTLPVEKLQELARAFSG